MICRTSHAPHSSGIKQSSPCRPGWTPGHRVKRRQCSGRGPVSP